MHNSILLEVITSKKEKAVMDDTDGPFSENTWGSKLYDLDDGVRPIDDAEKEPEEKEEIDDDELEDEDDDFEEDDYEEDDLDEDDDDFYYGEDEPEDDENDGLEEGGEAS